MDRAGGGGSWDDGMEVHTLICISAYSVADLCGGICVPPAGGS
jgi:hypothetical protein